MRDMKKLFIIFSLLILSLTLRGQSGLLPASGNPATWRSTINATTETFRDSIDFLKESTNLNYGFISSHGDSITALNERLLLRMLWSDTTLIIATRNWVSTNYAPLANPQFTGVPRIATDTISTNAGVRLMIAALGGGGGGTGELLWNDTIGTPRLATGWDIAQVAALSDLTDNVTIGTNGRNILKINSTIVLDTTLFDVPTGLNFGVHGADTVNIIGVVVDDSVKFRFAPYGAVGSGTGVSEARVAEMIDSALVAALDSGVEVIPYIDTTNIIATQPWVSAQLGSLDAMDYDTIDYLVAEIATLNQVLADIYTAMGNIGVDIQAPYIDSVEIGNYMDDVVRVYWSEPMITHGDSVPEYTVWSLTEDGVAKTINGYSFVNDSVMNIGLATAAEFGSTYLLSYTRVEPFLTDKALNPAANFTGRTVTNNVSEPVPEWDDYSIVTNGNFDDGSDWSFSSAAWSIADGVASFDRSGTGILAQGASRMQTPIEASEYYTISWVISGATGNNNLSLQDSTASTIYRIIYSSNASNTLAILTPASIGVGGIGFRASASSTSAFDIDSIKIIPTPNHVANDRFTSETNWTITGAIEIAGNTATYTAGTEALLVQENAQMAEPLEPSTVYHIVWEGTGTPTWSLRNASGTVTYNAIGAGQFTTPADLEGGGIMIRVSGTSDSFSMTRYRIVRFDPE